MLRPVQAIVTHLERFPARAGRRRLPSRRLLRRVPNAPTFGLLLTPSAAGRAPSSPEFRSDASPSTDMPATGVKTMKSPTTSRDTGLLRGLNRPCRGLAGIGQKMALVPESGGPYGSVPMFPRRTDRPASSRVIAAAAVDISAAPDLDPLLASCAELPESPLLLEVCRSVEAAEDRCSAGDDEQCIAHLEASLELLVGCEEEGANDEGPTPSERLAAKTGRLDPMSATSAASASPPRTTRATSSPSSARSRAARSARRPGAASSGARRAPTRSSTPRGSPGVTPPVRPRSSRHPATRRAARTSTGRSVAARSATSCAREPGGPGRRAPPAAGPAPRACGRRGAATRPT